MVEKRKGPPNPYKRREDIKRDIQRSIEEGSTKGAEYNVRKLHDPGSRDEYDFLPVVSAAAGALGGRFLGRRVAGVINRAKGRQHHGANMWSRNAKDNARYNREPPESRYLSRFDDPGRAAVIRAGRASGVAGGLTGYALGREGYLRSLKKRASRGAASSRDYNRNKYRGEGRYYRDERR